MFNHVFPSIPSVRHSHSHSSSVWSVIVQGCKGTNSDKYNISKKIDKDVNEITMYYSPKPYANYVTSSGKYILLL